MTNCPNQSWAKCCNHPSVSSQWLWVTSSPFLHHGKHTTLLGCKPCCFCLELPSLPAAVSPGVYGSLVSGEIEMERKGEERLYSKPPNGMHFLGLPIGRNLAACLSPICKGTEKHNLCLRKNFPSASMPWRIVFGSVFYLLQTSKCKQLNKGRHNWS